MEKSIILPWNKENINKAPMSCGVLMLRTTPVNGDVVDIRISPNLRNDLNLLLENGVNPDVKYFDWLPTENLERAEEARVELKKKYHLESLVD